MSAFPSGGGQAGMGGAYVIGSAVIEISTRFDGSGLQAAKSEVEAATSGAVGGSSGGQFVAQPHPAGGTSASGHLPPLPSAAGMAAQWSGSSGLGAFSIGSGGAALPSGAMSDAAGNLREVIQNELAAIISSLRDQSAGVGAAGDQVRPGTGPGMFGIRGAIARATGLPYGDVIAAGFLAHGVTEMVGAGVMGSAHDLALQGLYQPGNPLGMGNDPLIQQAALGAQSVQMNRGLLGGAQTVMTAAATAAMFAGQAEIAIPLYAASAASGIFGGVGLAREEQFNAQLEANQRFAIQGQREAEIGYSVARGNDLQAMQTKLDRALGDRASGVANQQKVLDDLIAQRRRWFLSSEGGAVESNVDQMMREQPEGADLQHQRELLQNLHQEFLGTQSELREQKENLRRRIEIGLPAQVTALYAGLQMAPVTSQWQRFQSQLADARPEGPERRLIEAGYNVGITEFTRSASLEEHHSLAATAAMQQTMQYHPLMAQATELIASAQERVMQSGAGARAMASARAEFAAHGGNEAAFNADMSRRQAILTEEQTRLQTMSWDIQHPLGGHVAISMPGAIALGTEAGFGLDLRHHRQDILGARNELSEAARHLGDQDFHDLDGNHHAGGGTGPTTQPAGRTSSNHNAPAGGSGWGTTHGMSLADRHAFAHQAQVARVTASRAAQAQDGGASHHADMLGHADTLRLYSAREHLSVDTSRLAVAQRNHATGEVSRLGRAIQHDQAVVALAEYAVAHPVGVGDSHAQPHPASTQPTTQPAQHPSTQPAMAGPSRADTIMSTLANHVQHLDASVQKLDRTLSQHH